MKISQEVRDYAAKNELGSEEAISEGMREKSEEFKTKGSEVYL